MHVRSQAALAAALSNVATSSVILAADTVWNLTDSEMPQHAAVVGSGRRVTLEGAMLSDGKSTYVDVSSPGSDL